MKRHGFFFLPCLSFLIISFIFNTCNNILNINIVVIENVKCVNILFFFLRPRVCRQLRFDQKKWKWLPYLLDLYNTYLNTIFYIKNFLPDLTNEVHPNLPSSNNILIKVQLPFLIDEKLMHHIIPLPTYRAS